MWLKSFHLKNFKSFEDSDKHQLDKRVNVLVGQNNTGKTALLQAVSLQISAIPHKSSKLRREDRPNPRSTIDIEFVLSGQEMKDALLGFDANVQVPVPGRWLDVGGDQKQGVLNKIFAEQEIVFSAQRFVTTANESGLAQTRYPSATFSEPITKHFIHFTRAPDHSSFHVAQIAGGENDNIATALLPKFLERVYFFNALRNPNATHPYGDRKSLDTNAANLAEVLGTLQPSPTAFRKYVETVRRVLPLIKWVSVTGAGGNQTEVRIWQVDESTGRDDLTIPLAQCGTGVGQVLAILYVVTQSSGNVILIDEPNSFLHPGAAKALMSILREDDKNQYIISTHSSEVIAAIDPAKMFVLGFEHEASTVKQVDRADLNSIVSFTRAATS